MKFNHYIENVFSLDPIYNIIADGLLHVKNDLFCKNFQEKFNEIYVSGKQPNTFKDITNEHNPLLKLTTLDGAANGTSLLVHALIKLVCEKIETIEKRELLHDTLLCPNEPSLISIVLFENAYKDLPVREKMIQQLMALWDEWETIGFQMDQLNTWTNLKPHVKEIAYRIWNFIKENNGKKKYFKQLIDEAQTKIIKILEVKGALTDCLNNYCEDACDKNRYLSLLNDLQQQVDKATISSEKIHPDIERLQPFTNDLNAIFDSHAWQYYFKQSIESKSKV